MKKSVILVCFLSAWASVAAFGDVVTNYVDRKLGEDVAGRGGKDEPFQSIQYAIENTAAGGVVLVAPGVYDNNYGIDTHGYTNRVYINKSITLRATGKKEDTIIQGALDTSATAVANGYGIGSAAIRCVRCDTGDTKCVIIEGFTLQGGACHTDANSTLAGYAGGLCASSDSTYLVGCTVRDCVGKRGGAIYHGTIIRTFITGNRAITKAVGAYRGILVNCLIAHNTGGGCTLVQAAAYNCTIDDNSGEGIASEGGSKLYNVCAVRGEGTLGDTSASSTGNVYAYNSLFSSENYKRSTYNTVREVTDCEVDASPYQYIAPIFNDYHLLPDAQARNVGDAKWLANITVPDEIDLYKDFEGASISTTGTIAAGAFQTPSAAPAGGAVVFANKVNIRGGVTAGYNYSYAFATNYPTQWYIKGADTTKQIYDYGIVNYSDLGMPGSLYYPEMDDGLWLMPPPVGKVMTNTVVYARTVLYVNPTAKAEEADGTSDHPYRTLQAAMEGVSSTPAVIFAAAGDYKEGFMAAGDFTNRVVVKSGVRLKGAGVGKSFIYGEIDTTSEGCSEDGRGEKAMRCCYVGEGCVQGFTITGGRTAYRGGTSNDTPATRGGGVLCASGARVIDCVITNCIGYRGGAIIYGNIYRCRISDCQAGNGITRYGKYFACQFDHMDNITNAVSVFGNNGEAYNCTITSVGASSTAWLGNCARNCIISRPSSVGTLGTITVDDVVDGSVIWQCSTYKKTPGEDYIKGDPRFVDDVMDLRILSDSPAIGAGSITDYWKYYSSDLDGNPVLFKDGKPTAGARQVPVQAVVVQKHEDADILTITSDVVGKADGTYALEPGNSITLTFSDTVRHVEAISMGDDDNSTRVEGRTWSFTAAADGTLPTAGIDATVKAVYSTNWYVNANIETSGDGFTPETAKKTFKEIFACAGLLNGDCVHAAEGCYKEGEMDSTDHVKARVNVPESVTIVADGSVHKTFIMGRKSDDAADCVDALGRGTNAVRCVYLNANSCVKGFTITGGRTCGSGIADNDNYGGGVMTSSTKSWVVDCIISNNASTRGGGVHNTRCINCQFFDNYVKKNRAAASLSYLYGCIFDHNRGANTIQNCYDVINCTFGTDNMTEDGTKRTDGYSLPNANYPISNCIFLGSWSASAGNKFYATNCVFNKTYRPQSASVVDNYIYDEATCKFVDLEDFKLDENYRPQVGSAVIDAGSNELAFFRDSLPRDKDLLDGQRIYNGTIDAGALEHDHRGEFAAALQRAACAVPVASSEVKIEEDGTMLTITNRLETTLARNQDGNTAVRYGVNVEVTGTGTLAVLLNGEEWKTFTAADGAQRAFFRNALTQNAITFLYTPGVEDTGLAKVKPFSMPGGTTIFIR